MKKRKIYTIASITVIGILVLIGFIIPTRFTRNTHYKFSTGHNLLRHTINKDTTLYFLLDSDTIIAWKNSHNYAEWNSKQKKNYVLAYDNPQAKNTFFDENGGLVIFQNGKKIKVIFLNAKDSHIIDYIPIEDTEINILLANDENIIEKHHLSNTNFTTIISCKTNYDREIAVKLKNGEWRDEGNYIFFPETGATIKIRFKK